DLVSAGTISGGLAALFAILVFMGPIAKSAQFPLHVWLPDAMEGPTPISALIHAATMVAAGVFLIARMYPVFENIPAVMGVIAWTGTITAFLGASIAITQNDIKKGLAFSTMSQLGYMVMAMGVGAYTAGLFHLMTHAYFKAMLFLGSGSVIHGMEEVVGHDPALAQDMRLMGGLRKYMPVTAITFLIGTLAISGLPPFAGFWSKDEILGSTFAVSPALWAIGWLTAGITAFYMFRMYFSTFEGEFRGNEEDIRKQLKIEQMQRMGLSIGPGAMNSQELTVEHDTHDDHHHSSEPHESPFTMTFPLMALAIPSMLVGLLGTPFANYFEAFIHPPGELVEAMPALEIPAEFEWGEFLIMGGSSVGIGLIGITLASLMYVSRVINPAAIAQSIQPLYKLSLNKWYFDEIYDAVFVKGTRRLARQVLEVDIRIVDGIVNLAGFVTLVTGEGLKYLENGRAQFYALIVFGAVLGLVLVSGIT
ncbi:MAG: NADH-quinone oxidoreductase subunit L, partial [Cyanobacteria bacterium J06659_2]